MCDYFEPGVILEPMFRLFAFVSCVASEPCNAMRRENKNAILMSRNGWNVFARYVHQWAFPCGLPMRIVLFADLGDTKGEGEILAAFF